MLRAEVSYRLLTVAAFASLGSFVSTPVHAQDSDAAIVKQIDQHIQQTWTDYEVKPSPRAADGEWARRVSLDIVGHIPSYDQLMDFLEDTSPDKRQKFVNMLLDEPDYIRNWTNIWGNLLVGRGNGGNRAALDAWLRRQFYKNTPYDEFVHELISAEGDPTRNGAVAFLSSHLNEMAVPATSITSRIFLGQQVQCTQCHNHPFNDWKQEQFWGMNAFFRGTSSQRGMGLVDAPTQQMIFFEKRSGLMKATSRRFVDGSKVPVNGEVKPRQQLADLITDSDKPYMSEAIVNRMWGHFFGYGFTKPVDDMGPHNPPSHPELLSYLAKEFQRANYDLKRLIRWITLSEAYNLTSKIGENNQIDRPSAGEVALFSHMYLKQFTAEQLYDSLIVATAADQSGRSEDAAQQQRNNWLRQFVQTFGTDENDDYTTFNGTIPQALVMMNGSLTNAALNGGDGSFLRRVVDSPNGKLPRSSKNSTSRRPRRTNPPRNRYGSMPQKIETLFLVALARKPTEEELNSFNQIFKDGEQTNPIEGLQDVFWAILNSNEFIINH